MLYQIVRRDKPNLYITTSMFKSGEIVTRAAPMLAWAIGMTKTELRKELRQRDWALRAVVATGGNDKCGRSPGD